MAAWIQASKKHITYISGGLLILAMAGQFYGSVELRQAALIGATLIALLPIGLKAFQAAQLKAFSIELLVTIAVIGALGIGEYVESAVVTFLFLFGERLEARTLEKTRASIRDLADKAPEEAVIFRKGETVTVPLSEVVQGDRVIVRTGGKVPVDGTILSGQASLNEAPITGEASLVQKSSGDRVFSSTVIESGFIEVAAERVGEGTIFSKILELVEDAQEMKTKTEKFLDRFAHFYTPAVVALSIGVFAATRDFHQAITFLVIACPGALVIGAPVSSVAGIGNGAKNGILIKGGEAMERFAKVDTVVFDKTGTLTNGKPEVTDIRPFSPYGEAELLRAVAAAETASEHHLGRTIVSEAKRRNLEVGSPEKVKVKKGSGLMAAIDGQCWAIGNRKLMKYKGVFIPEAAEAYALEREKAGNTAVFAAVDGELAGLISIADEIREDAAQAIAKLRKNGVKQVIMLTGDNQHTAEGVADRLGLDAYHAELLPEDKVAFVKALQAEGHVVAMAGDGVNDAPAIASADIGIAMGKGGTDISMETADAVLMADKLLQFAHALALSKATVRNMKQNTFFAVGTVLLLLAGVLMGKVHLASGMFIHEASVLLVILNAMRLIRFNNKEVPAKPAANRGIGRPRSEFKGTA